jgi:hypothetical protein
LCVEVVRATDRRVDIRRDSRRVELGRVGIGRGVVGIKSSSKGGVKLRRTITGNVQSTRTWALLGAMTLGFLVRLVEAVAEEIMVIRISEKVALLSVAAQEVVHARVVGVAMLL